MITCTWIIENIISLVIKIDITYKRTLTKALNAALWEVISYIQHPRKEIINNI